VIQIPEFGYYLSIARQLFAKVRTVPDWDWVAQISIYERTHKEYRDLMNKLIKSLLLAEVVKKRNP
jgi:hypothetical protein